MRCVYIRKWILLDLSVEWDDNSDKRTRFDNSYTRTIQDNSRHTRYDNCKNKTPAFIDVKFSI